MLLSGKALRRIAEACSVARTLQPSVIVVEDVDLIAEQREFGGGKLRLELSEPDTMIGRTEGVTASFMKELLRRAALSAADESADEMPGKPITVTDAHMAIALDQLLDTRNQLTRMLLGGQPRSGAGQVLHEGGGDLAGLGDVGEVRTAADHPEPGTADG
jgi:hypothetical protein